MAGHGVIAGGAAGLDVAKSLVRGRIDQDQLLRTKGFACC
jgi:hypothetical protein